jgi:hypothetical protein
METLLAYKLQLEKLAEGEPVETGFYFDEPYEPNVDGDYCELCANWIVELMRCKLIMDCLAFLPYPVLAQRYYQFYWQWWEFSWWGESEIHPHVSWTERDNMICCDRCSVMLSYSLTEYGIASEIEHFESLENISIDSREAYQLWQIFDSALDLEVFVDELIFLGKKYLG